ncbi:MAG: division/cell wall cluster transcriptional repressor MraZ [Chloroflexi bacterium]|nr:division/cell wall cluster transcriptional repressor MraZ [Chloroflexota bacterium]
MTFLGNYEHTLDDRGRVAIPAKYRADFPGRRAVIIPLPEGCLQVYPEPAFRKMLEDVRSKPLTDLAGRRLRRQFEGQSFEAELDRQGRILIPARSREKIGLNGTVIIVGTGECLEIWTQEGWDKEVEETTKVPPTGQDQVD